MILITLQKQSLGEKWMDQPPNISCLIKVPVKEEPFERKRNAECFVPWKWEGRSWSRNLGCPRTIRLCGKRPSNLASCQGRRGSLCNIPRGLVLGGSLGNVLSQTTMFEVLWFSFKNAHGSCCRNWWSRSVTRTCRQYAKKSLPCRPEREIKWYKKPALIGNSDSVFLKGQKFTAGLWIQNLNAKEYLGLRVVL